MFKYACTEHVTFFMEGLAIFTWHFRKYKVYDLMAGSLFDIVVVSPVYA